MEEELIFMHGGAIPRCIRTVDKAFAYHLLQLTTSGGIDLWCDGRKTEMRGPHAWLCHPGPHYYFHEAPRGSPWCHRYLAFTGPLAVKWESTGFLPRSPQPLRDASGWGERFDQLVAESQDTRRFSRMRAVNLLECMLIDLAELRDSCLDDPPAWLQRVLEQLHGPAEPDYQRIAKSESMSLATLRRRFRNATGMSPHAYRLQHRIATAKRLLGDSDLPIKVIADKLGYNDLFYFTRQFTQIAGVPPAKFRKSRQQ